ncbi:unnamed protein product [Closterium sp. Yama58-4]|nr:unnamed protein product [Closterium sp. Yama58-4]
MSMLLSFAPVPPTDKPTTNKSVLTHVLTLASMWCTSVRPSAALLEASAASLWAASSRASACGSRCHLRLPSIQPLSLPRADRPRTRRSPSLHVVAVGWDPEGILAPPQPGHIARRKAQHQMVDEEAERAKREAAAKQEAARRREARASRVVPDTDEGLIEFFLSTEVPDMEAEIARCRPRLTPAFFTALRTAMGQLRFAARPSADDADKLAELEALETVLQEGIAAYDALEKAMTGAKERLQRLLSAKDKRAELLAMAASNELDRDLLALLDENIAAATAANQKEAVEFMEKVRGAMVKYMVKS